MSKPNKSNKNSKSSTSKTNKAKTPKASRGVGRPRYDAKIPNGKFTMRQFCEYNGVNPDTGKGEKCSKLTLIKFMERDQHPKIKSGKNAGKLDKNRIRPDSLIVQLDETSAPTGEKGLGRKAFVYQKRCKIKATPSDATVTVPIVDVTPAPVVDATPATDPAPVDAPASTETVNA